MSDTPIVPQKRCCDCMQYFDATHEFFNRDKKGKYGCSSRCKKCAILAAQKWQNENPELAKAKNRDYYLNHQDEIKFTSKQWRENNPEQDKENHSNYYQENKPTFIAKAKQWGIDNREKSNQIKYDWRKRNPEYGRMVARLRRERVKNADGTFSKQDVYRLYDEQDGLCAYCGMRILWEIPNDIHIDHIHAIARGGSNWPDNLCLACADCNLSKQDKTVTEWQLARGW